MESFIRGLWKVKLLRTKRVTNLFEHNDTGLPAEVRWFDVEKLENGKRLELKIKYQGKDYLGHVDKTSNRTRIHWETRLGAEFAIYYDDGNYPVARFEKIDKNCYVVVIENASKRIELPKYSVNDAVWIAVALMAAEVYTNNPKATKSDMFFKQADIVKRAQALTDKKVDFARVSWWTNADNENSTHNYLRADSKADNTMRRLTMLDEFSEKTFPENLDMEHMFKMDDREMMMEELLFFVREQYPSVILREKKNKRNQKIPYSNSEEKRAWLLTWNPANWPWDEYEEWCNGTKNGEKYIISWTCNSKKPKLGDDVFLMKTGDKPRGIIAHGCVVTEPYEGLHYDPEKADKGITSKHIDVEYDWIQNCDKNEKILFQNELKEKFPQQTWSPMGSGIEIKEPIVMELKEEWEDLISNTDDGFWPSPEEYNPEITKEDWINFINEVEKPEHPSPMKMLVAMLELGGQASCKQLSEVYGGTPNAYIGCTTSLGRRAKKYFEKPGCMDNGQERVFVLPFQGKRMSGESGEYYVYRIRPELKAALAEINLSEFNPYYYENEGESEKMINYSKNTILYGPPGTGKTYETVVYAVAIIENKELNVVKEESYKEVFERYNEYKKEGLVAFTTFHQSYGYEEFIEGIKPIISKETTSLGYKIEDGVFKEFCDRAGKYILMPEGIDMDNKTVWSITVDNNDEVDTCFDYESIGIPDYGVPEDFTDDTLPDTVPSDIQETLINFQYEMSIGDVVLLTNTSNDRQLLGFVVSKAKYDDLESEDYPRRREVRWCVEKQKVYEVSANGCYRLNIDSKKLAEMFYDEGIRNYVFIIDEINRGNISKIFGELITLLEDTKRAGTDEAASAVLPYSGEHFSVPSNVYILGTMNTADRSIALMDTALRRRFDFIEMMPDADVLRAIGADKVEDLDVAAMLEKINERIMFLYDREHTIGHAFFTKLAKEPTIETLKSIFEKSVIPLLQEYFYEDYQKIQLVLGDNGKSNDAHKFILDTDVKVKDIFKGSVDDVIDLPEKKYAINSEAFLNIDSYKEII